MINKKILLSGISILSAITLMGGSALAAFTTSATATSNTFSTTNPSLLVDTGGGFGTSVTGFTEIGIVPGGSPVTHNFNLKNADSDPAATMTLTGVFSSLGGTLPPADLNVNITCNNGANETHTVAFWNSTGAGLGTLGPGATTNCTMAASLPGGNTTDANKTVSFNAVFSASVGT